MTSEQEADDGNPYSSPPMPTDQITFMTGPVTWQGVVALFSIGGTLVTAVFGVLVWYFTSKSKDFKEIRELLKERDRTWEKRHEVHKAEVGQAHRELHDRISRTDERLRETERTARNETAKSIEKLEERLSRRVDALTAKIDDMGKEILAFLKGKA